MKVGRIQNFKSWSPELVPDQKLACYGLEYFCFEGDGVWTAPDSVLIRLAAQEMHKLGLLNPAMFWMGAWFVSPRPTRSMTTITNPT